MLFNSMRLVRRFIPPGSTVLEHIATSPLTFWWANYGLSLCAVDHTVSLPEEASHRCPVLRVVAQLRGGGG